MEYYKLLCPECKKLTRIVQGKWDRCEHCYTLVFLGRLTTRFLELKSGAIENNKFILRDFGRVYFTQGKKPLLKVDLEHLADIKKLVYDQEAFDRNIAEWQNIVKQQHKVRTSAYTVYQPLPPLELRFWQTGFEIGRRVYSLPQATQREPSRVSISGYSDKDVQLFAQKKLDPQFWQIGMMRTEQNQGFYLHPPKESFSFDLGGIVEWGLGEVFLALLAIVFVIGMLILFFNEVTP